MKSLIVAAALAVSGNVFALGVDFNQDQFRAVANAIFEQSRLADGERLRAIIDLRSNSGGRLFVIQYSDDRRGCTQETADVFSKKDADGNVHTNVTFFRVARAACQ
jgi:hypothetical protein